LSIFKKGENESDYEFKERIIVAKINGDIDLDWVEIRDILNLDCSPDHLRKVAKGIYESYNFYNGNDKTIDDIDNKIIELKKEKQKLYDQRAALNELIRGLSRQEEFKDLIERAIHKNNLIKLDYIPPKNPFISENDLLISHNDPHYGAFVDNAWNKYNSDIFIEMNKKYLDKILQIKSLHKSQNCYVWANGDLISGKIHNSIRVTNRENIIQQILGVSEVYTQFLSELSKHFYGVYLMMLPGNHSRIEDKDKALKNERLDDLVEWYLKARLQNFENIVFDAHERIDETMYLVDIRGKTYCGVHGDLDKDIKGLLPFAQRNIYAILMGHQHHNSTDTIQGIKVIMAGSFLGMDDYCIEKRIFGNPEQTVTVCDLNGIVCNYDIQLKVGV